MTQGASPFLEELRRALRVRHYSIRTEQAYRMWVRRSILFHGKRHPRDMGAAEVGALGAPKASTAHVARAVSRWRAAMGADTLQTRPGWGNALLAVVEPAFPGVGCPRRRLATACGHLSGP